MKFSFKLRIIIKLTFLLFTLLIIKCQKGFSVEVYPSEVDEDNSIVAGDDLYRNNMRSMWNNINPYYGYTNNPYVMPQYMPMYGYNQPVMGGNNYMGGQRSLTPNPMNFNYPKLAHAKTSQYQNYPRFKEGEEQRQEQRDVKELAKTKEQEGLAKELEKQIKELQKLTKEAKELAKKKSSEEKQKNLDLQEKYQNQKNSQNNIKRLRHSNLDNLTLGAHQKTQFDQGMKTILDKLDKLS